MTSGNHQNVNPILNDALPQPTAHAPAWSPAALLNPRQAAVTGPREQPKSPKTARPTTNSGSQNHEVIYQFASPNHGGPGRPDLQMPQHTPHNTDQPTFTNGMGSYLEWANNVQDRASTPQKRRKIEVPNGNSESNPGGGSRGSGVLGEYVKEKREEGKRDGQAVPTVPTVDLTDANDDVATVTDPLEEEVCYGKIQARLQCFKVPSPKPGMTSVFGPRYHPVVKVVLKRIAGDKTNRIQAYDHTRDIIGNLDINTAGTLAPLLDGLRRLRTDCRIPPRQKTDDEIPGQPISKSYKLDLVIYGPLRFTKTVGKHLTDNGFVLGSAIVEKGIRVVNPHAAATLPPGAVRSYPAESYSRPATTFRTQEEMRTEVLGLFDTLTKSDEWPEAMPNSAITTPLLKHQKQGLYFMEMREKAREQHDDGKMSKSLWKEKLTGSLENGYSNVVTGEVIRQRPDDSFGGILADMMGLGKTLSVLALVTKSLEEADQWAARAPQQPREPDMRRSKTGPPTQPGLGLTPLVQNAKTTLLVCPLSTVTNWEEQIKQHVQPGALNFYIYHGPNRIKNIQELASFDLVITTYGSVSSELSSRAKRKQGNHPLEQIGWFRIVLDEAHMIRDHQTLQFKAICRLQACRRWAVTGTPVQNRLDDLGALLAFLRLKPFDNRNKFLKYLVEPFKACDPDIVPKLRVLVDSVTLRRLKDKIDLPKRVDHVVKLNFTASERHIYDLFAKNAQDRVRILAGGPGTEKALGGHTYIHILRAILRLRLVCAHGKDLLNDEDLQTLQGMTAEMAIDIDSDEEDDTAPALSERKAYEMFQLMQDTNADTCVDCGKKLTVNDDASNIESEGQEDVLGYMTPCFHIICCSCLKSFKEKASQLCAPGQTYGACPSCGQVVRASYVEIRRTEAAVEHEGLPRTHSTSKAKRALENYTGPHTKTRALIEDLLKSEEQSRAEPSEAPYKSVVFSGWTSHLDLIQRALGDNGIKYTRLDGTMTRMARTAAMDAFRDDPAVHVILVSIMAGGLGLNLTAASNVYVMEPQFNPAAEAQAVDRIHRLGQKREVRTVRYIMRDSFEEKMVELQEKKMKLASLSVDGRDRAPDRGEAARQKLMDLRTLFR